MKKIFLFVCLTVYSLQAFSQISFDVHSGRLDESLLNILCDDELKWLRNEIYARHGYVFSTKEIQAHFEKQDWYKPVSDNSQVKLSEKDQENVTILKNAETKRAARASAVKAYFKKMKAELAKGGDSSIDMPLQYHMSKTLDNIDVDQMHFCAGKGLYQKTIDNGFSEISYYLKLDGNEIFVGYNSIGVSSIFPERERHAAGDDDFTAQKRVGEYLDFWKFAIDDDNQITFVEVGGAG